MTFTACSSSEDGVEVDNPKTPVLAQKVPVGFNAYANRGLTRSGVAGDLDLTALEAPAGVGSADGGGFGVFAYYTDLKKYDQTYIPNFMYNQGVFKNGANWEYTPVMYWPNESGSDAQSDDEDKVSFFAYAPYVKHTSAASGSVADATYGITGFSRNSTAGDPIVKYIASFDPAKSVDLCWGVCAGTSWAKFQGAANQTMQEGLPWTDVEHPQGIDQKMTFTFRHALSQLNVQIDADPDIATHNETSEVAAGTKVYVRSISFTGIATHGALNLNNTEKDKPLWLDYSGTTDLPYGESVTVKDGRRDGREGATGAEATNETPAGLNPQIVQNNPTTTGVTHQLQNLFNGAAVTTPVYVIPTGEKMTVSIVYDVETVNPNLSGYTSDGVTHGVSVENKITKDITWSAGTGLEAGKKYTLKLHLGMNSVQFDADVAPWDDSTVNGSGWLPENYNENVPAVHINNNGVQVTHSTMSLSDATLALTGAVTPSAADQTLTWISSDDAIATVAANGTVTAVADGECTITATSVATGNSATMKLLVTHKYSDVAVADVGKIIAANGYIYANTTKAAEYGTNGVGLICYAGAAGSVDTDLSAASYKALALALTEANNGAYCQWCDVETNSCLPNQLTDYANPYVTESSYQSGIANTSTLIGDGHTHVAAQAAHDYSVAVNGFTNSGWFLPSISQWNMMIKTLAPTSESDVLTFGEDLTFHNGSDIPVDTWTNAGYTLTALNPVITATGASGLRNFYYWSSTEVSAENVWNVAFNKGCVYYKYPKTNQWLVRAALAF